jgi:hypothetical protein
MMLENMYGNEMFINRASDLEVQCEELSMNMQSSNEKEITDVDIYAFQLPQPQQEIVQQLRAFIAHKYPKLNESLRWHVPVYSLNGTSHLLGIQVFKRHVKLNFFRGAQLDDPQRILVGSGKQVRHVTFRTIDHIDYSALQALIDQTLANELLSKG